jgi:ATP-dependent DNA helicase RecQ
MNFVRRGLFRILYVAPERFTKKFVKEISLLKISLMAIDEAHCVDMWGHGFRPKYLRLGEIREKLGGPPIIALTATATPRIRQEIVRQLHLENPKVIVRGFNRPNISLNVSRASDDDDKRNQLLRLLKSLKGTGIIYASTRKKAREIAEFLEKYKIKYVIYHGRLPSRVRSYAQDLFNEDEVKVMIATKAFGMGIDKKDIRFIIHYDLPSNISDYYQAIGRSGRDGRPSVAILLYTEGDEETQKGLIESSYPDEKSIKATWNPITENVSIDGILRSHESEFPEKHKTEAVLKILEDKEYIRFRSRTFDEEKLYYIEVLEKVPFEELKIDFQKILKRRELEEKELDDLLKYINTKDCRRKHLLSYFGDDSKPISTGKCCDNCETKGSILTRLAMSILGKEKAFKIAISPEILNERSMMFKESKKILYRVHD